MREVVLVRHGQASYGTEDYDRLSPTGFDQMRRLGAYWQSHPPRKRTTIFRGPLRRHRESAQALLETFERGTEAHELSEFAEFRAFELAMRHVDAVAERDAYVRRHREENPGADHLPPPVLMRVLGHWARGEVEPQGEDSFAAFAARVQHGLAAVANSLSEGERAVVVTSGGPKAVAMMRALELAPDRAIALCFSIVNASFSTFRAFDGHFVLFRFNAHPHLEPEGPVTFV